MKKSALLAAFPLAAVILVSCSQPAPCPPAAEQFTHPLVSISPEADANIAVVDGYLNALIKADGAAIRAACAPGFYAHSTFTPSDSSDVEAVITHWQKNDSTRSDQKLSTIFAECVTVAEGNKFAGHWVHVWADYSAVDKKTGKPYVVPFFYDAQVKDGKIVKSYTYFDRLSVFHQLGTTPPAAPPAKKDAKKK